MTPDDVKSLHRRVAEWVASPEGQKQLQKRAERCRQMQIDAEQKRRDDIRWWHEIKDKPMTI
jgi:hypothetical protein